MWYHKYFEYAEINGGVHSFCYRQETPFLGKFGLKIKIVSLSWHLVPRLTRICNVELNGAVPFLYFKPETPFLGKFGPKTQNCQFKLTFGTWTNSKMQNSMAMFIFYILDRKYSFWKNLVQKVEIASLSWNLVARLIRINKTQWCCSLFLFYTGNTCFGKRN